VDGDGVERVRPQPRLDGPVRLAEPDPGWAAAYDEVAGRVRTTLGARALAVHHVGSTSVPDLAAKPVLDVLLLVTAPADEPAYVPDLERAGFALHMREPRWYEHRLLKATGPDVNLHVFAPDAEEVGRMLAFRDRLRTHSEDRLLYERTKRGLAARSWPTVQDYADAKSRVVEGILSRASRPG
jgi:GrpB-like predicted nucleotidyltransferase (UPF0157 family)